MSGDDKRLPLNKSSLLQIGNHELPDRCLLRVVLPADDDASGGGHLQIQRYEDIQALPSNKQIQSNCTKSLLNIKLVCKDPKHFTFCQNWTRVELKVGLRAWPPALKCSMIAASRFVGACGGTSFSSRRGYRSLTAL